MTYIIGYNNPNMSSDATVQLAHIGEIPNGGFITVDDSVVENYPTLTSTVKTTFTENGVETETVFGKSLEEALQTIPFTSFTGKDK